MVVVQLFNQAFSKVEKQLARLGRLGVSHVLVSPPQKSNASRSWWGRYQPVDFTRIEGPLGGLAAFASMCAEANRLGIGIVVDAVLHHLSNESRYLKLSHGHILWAQYPRFSQADLRGLHGLGRGRPLPILNTDSPWVRSQLRDFLHGLVGLGVRGFRFDSAKHMDPYLFPALLHGLPPLLCFGELVYARAEDFPPAYWQSMKALDFPLAHSLKEAFAPGGDLGSLVQPHGLWGPHSVSFVNHHDMVRNRAAFDYFRIGDGRDRALAYAYLLGRLDGLPLVYGPDLRLAEVKAGLQFRQRCGASGLDWLVAERTRLAWRRGAEGLVALNKSGQWWSLRLPMAPGRYRELVAGYRGQTQGGWLAWELAPRSAAMLVRD